jgi:hypothetical protein
VRKTLVLTKFVGTSAGVVTSRGPYGEALRAFLNARSPFAPFTPHVGGPLTAVPPLPDTLTLPEATTLRELGLPFSDTERWPLEPQG